MPPPSDFRTPAGAPPARWSRFRRDCAGARPKLAAFTLVDASLFILCLGLAAYVAISELGKFRHRSNRDTLVAQLREIATVFSTHQAQKGEWPAATNPENRVPRGLETALAKTAWSSGSPFGGSFHWTPPARLAPSNPEGGGRSTNSGVIALTAFSPDRPLSLSRADLRYIDQKIDDGDLSTGRFQTGFNGWPIYLVPASR